MKMDLETVLKDIENHGRDLEHFCNIMREVPPWAKRHITTVSKPKDD